MPGARNRPDREIDELVYELYGITEEERKLMEDGQYRGTTWDSNTMWMADGTRNQNRPGLRS